MYRTCRIYVSIVSIVAVILGLHTNETHVLISYNILRIMYNIRYFCMSTYVKLIRSKIFFDIETMHKLFKRVKFSSGKNV